MSPLFRIERDRTIVALAKEGTSYAKIAKDYDLTRQRVSQICKRAGLAKKFPIPQSSEIA